MAIRTAACPRPSFPPIRCGAARGAILKLRQSEDIGDDAFHQLEEELDRAELGAHG